MFKKGDKVALICSWDDKGTMYIRRGVVHSCGSKVLRVQYENGEMFKAAFEPNRSSNRLTFVADDTDEALEAVALAQAERLLIDERAHFDRCLAGGHGAAYDASIRRSIEVLHEPRVIWR